MTRTIRARFRDGLLEPLEPLDLEDGEEVVITVADRSLVDQEVDALAASAGGWKDLLDCEQFETDNDASRSLQLRSEATQLAGPPTDRPEGATTAIEELRLSGILMRDEWFGLRLLCEVREAPYGWTATELAARIAKPVDSIAPTLSLLVRHRALEVADNRFVCTADGIALLERIDAIISEPEVLDEVVLT